MIKIQQFDHVNLNVRDVERSIKFYKDVLGCDLVRRDVDKLGRTTFVAVKAGPQIVDIRPVPEYTPPAEHNPKIHGFNHLAFTIDPVDAKSLVADLRAKGVEIQRGPTQNRGARGLGTALYFYDPDRYVVEVKWYPKGARPVRPIKTQSRRRR